MNKCAVYYYATKTYIQKLYTISYCHVSCANLVNFVVFPRLAQYMHSQRILSRIITEFNKPCESVFTVSFVRGRCSSLSATRPLRVLSWAQTLKTLRCGERSAHALDMVKSCWRAVYPISRKDTLELYKFGDLVYKWLETSVTNNTKKHGKSGRRRRHGDGRQIQILFRRDWRTKIWKLYFPFLPFPFIFSCGSDVGVQSCFQVNRCMWLPRCPLMARFGLFIALNSLKHLFLPVSNANSVCFLFHLSRYQYRNSRIIGSLLWLLKITFRPHLHKKPSSNFYVPSEFLVKS